MGRVCWPAVPPLHQWCYTMCAKQWFCLVKNPFSALFSVPSLIQVAMTFKNQQVLINCSWEVKKGERVGLVGEPRPGPPCLHSPGSPS